MRVSSVCLLPIFAFLRINAVPPEACFADFRWDDCGQSPVPVMYYWKPGSRCEVGFWRGCLPSLNMFQDEYECITTCIFAARAMPEDYHSLNEIEIEGATDSLGNILNTSVGDDTANTTVTADGSSTATNTSITANTKTATNATGTETVTPANVTVTPATNTTVNS